MTDDSVPVIVMTDSNREHAGRSGRESSVLVHPSRRICGAVCVPGDKSISHRTAMLCALARGASRIRGFLRSADCMSTLKAVGMLGARVSLSAGEVVIEGTGGRFSRPDGVIDLGNSGTGMRLLSGLLAGHAFTSELTGDASLRSRPMRRIKEPLEMMGARVDLLGAGGRAPVRVTGAAELRPIDYVLPVASAQVKSCALFAGLYCGGTTTVTEPAPTRDHTERMLGAFGADILVEGLRISLKGSGREGPSFRARDWSVPGDFSSAAFLLTAAACCEGSEVTVRNVGLNPRRTAFLDVLRAMGAEVEVRSDVDQGGGEPAGNVTVRGRGLKGVEVGGGVIPNLIDELPLVAAAGASAEGVTVIRDAEELRAKESDRIGSMARNLGLLGVDVEEKPDGLIVKGGRSIKGGVTAGSYGDHRVAMATAVLALGASGPVRIADVGWVSTSYPSFWEDMEKIGGHVEGYRGD